jgi:8-oxo-dGTP pyrophosphatase MutT (NUDIX family)
MARIISRTETYVSPWIRLVRKEVEFSPGQKPETYHAISQADYISILAVTRSGLIPLVHQFRPAVEAYTWELPAGLVEKGEDPEETCRRELKEETGLASESIVSLGVCYTDTGRYENPVHTFYVRASDPDPLFEPEPGMSVEFITPEQLRDYLRSGKFRHQLHMGVLASAAIAGYWSFQ